MQWKVFKSNGFDVTVKVNWISTDFLGVTLDLEHTSSVSICRIDTKQTNGIIK